MRQQFRVIILDVMGFDLPDDYFYEDTGSYLWAKVEGDNVKIGLTSLGLTLAGDVVYVEVPDVGDEVEQGEAFGVVETVKATAELNSPVSGEVVERNETAADDPNTLKDDPWFIVVAPSDMAGEKGNLLDATGAKDYYTEEITRAKDEGLLE